MFGDNKKVMMRLFDQESLPEHLDVQNVKTKWIWTPKLNRDKKKIHFSVKALKSLKTSVFSKKEKTCIWTFIT